MSLVRLGSLLIVFALAAKADAGARACSSPQVDPKTGDVVAESEKQAVKEGPHGCTPAGGPKPDVPTQPTPAPEPEKPAVAIKPADPQHRDQPLPANDTASTEKKPTDKPAV